MHYFKNLKGLALKRKTFSIDPKAYWEENTLKTSLKFNFRNKSMSKVITVNQDN